LGQTRGELLEEVIPYPDRHGPEYSRAQNEQKSALRAARRLLQGAPHPFISSDHVAPSVRPAHPLSRKRKLHLSQAIISLDDYAQFVPLRDRLKNLVNFWACNACLQFHDNLSLKL
jgi:hypothetical protein